RAGRTGLDASSVGDAPGDIDRDRPLVLGGFSQGSMVAVEAVLSAGVRPAGLIILSGALVARERWARLLREHEELVRGLPVFQSHGLDDPILPIAGARALGALLEEHGARREFTTFAGGHAIPAQAVEHASAWLEQFLPS
ncbi:MAG: alpha/beta hydrolase, partial [Spirochaetota bacterium]